MIKYLLKKFEDKAGEKSSATFFLNDQISYEVIRSRKQFLLHFVDQGSPEKNLEDQIKSFTTFID